jgi:hypothetical protein
MEIPNTSLGFEILLLKRDDAVIPMAVGSKNISNQIKLFEKARKARKAIDILLF